MRGRRRPQRELTYLIDLESMVGPKHPIREVKRMCEEVFEVWTHVDTTRTLAHVMGVNGIV